MIRVLVADDDRAVREGVRTLLATEPEIEIVGEAADGSTALALARSLRPDLVVLDDSMPGLSSVEAARTLKAELPGTAVVFLAREPTFRDLALAAGASAFVPKDASSEELLRALRASIAGVSVRQALNASRPEARRLVELLLGSRLMTQQQIQDAFASRGNGESLVQVIMRLGLVGQAEFADILARATDTPLVSLAPYPEIGAPIDPTEGRLSSTRLVDPVDRDAARLLPVDVARGLGVLVTGSDRGHGVLAMSDPLDDAAFEEAERRSKLRLTRVTTTADDIKDTFDRVWSTAGRSHVIWTGAVLSKLYAAAVLAAIFGMGLLLFGLFVRDALAPRFAFSLFALLCGVIFFLYALKYYVTIASVLVITLFGDPAKFQGRHGNGNGNGHANGNGLKATGEATRGNANGQHKEGYRTLRGEKLSEAGTVVVDDPWERMGEIRLPADRQPFVSIHLALYNEGRVVDRLLEACTSFDYENYEVIVADDSTDETVEKLKRWHDHPRVRVIHRSSRKGFKGGALQEALRRMNPRTEYVMVFDADFVPPADAIWHFLDYFGRLTKPKNGNGASGHAKSATGAPQNGDRLAVVQGYQWHMLNASENWITKGVRAEFSGSYVLERAGQELFGAMKMISGSVYMIRADVLRKLGWSTSITEDWELTIRLYLAGYKVLYTPYIQAPAECVSKVRQLVKQRMRWAEGHTYNVKKYFWPILRSPNLTWQEKLEFVYYAPYYLQSVLFSVATVAWIVGVLILGQKLPMWGEAFGWSLVVSNALALPLMNLTGVLLEGSLKRDALGLLSFIGLSWILVPFQAYASVKALFERKEGGWVRTPKSGHVTEALERFHLARLMPWELPRRKRGQGKSSGARRIAATATVVVAAAGIITVGALSIRAAATTGTATESDLAIPAIIGTAVPLAILSLGWLRLRRRTTAIVLAFTLGLGTNVLFLAHAVPASAVVDNTSTFTLARTASFASPNLDMRQSYAPQGGGAITWRSTTINQYNNRNYLTTTPPTGLSSGDVIVGAYTWVCGASCGTIQITPPAGWTAGASATTSTAPGLYTQVFWRSVSNPAAEPPTYTFNSNYSADVVGWLSAYSGSDTTDPVETSSATAVAACTIPCTYDSPTITATVANTLLVTSHVAGCGNTTNIWSPPSGMTERGENDSSVVGDIGVEVNDQTVGAGATGTRSATLSSGGTCSGSVVGLGASVVLRSAPTTCPTTAGGSWTCKFVSDQWTQGGSVGGNIQSHLYLDNAVVPSFSCVGAPTQGTGATSIALNKPACATSAGLLMIAALSVRGGTGNPAFTPPDGTWNLIGTRADYSTFLSLALYWHVSTASEPASYTWSWGATSQKAVGVIDVFAGVDTTTPIDASAVGAQQGGGTVTAGPITTSYENDMLVYLGGDTTNLGGVAQWTPPTAFSEDADSWSTGNSQNSNVSLGLDHLTTVQLGTGTIGPIGGSNTAANVAGATVAALKPAVHTCPISETLWHKYAPLYVTPNGSTAASVNGPTALSLAKPSGVAQNDVMIASIAYAGGSNVTSITVPSGWTLIGTATNSTTVVGLAVYRKTAGVSEAGPYSWSFSPTQNASGVISAYRNVDTTTPVDQQAYLATAAPACPSSCTHTTASITPANTDDIIIASFVTAANDTWTEPASMTETGDTVNTGATFTALEQANVAQGAAAAVSKTATAVSTSAVGITHILALKPKASTQLGTATRSITSPTSGMALYTDTLASNLSTEQMNLNDRLEFDVNVNDTTNCGAQLTYDSETENSNINVATVVPENVLGLLLLGPAVPFAARWWKRRRP